jgi:trimethylamine--corrinoid protein Co-methyltransferase
MDADQLGALHKMAQGVRIDEDAQAMDAIAEVGPGGHYLGCAHTQANFKTSFWRSEVFDFKPYETWSEEGARDTMALATERVQRLIDTYQQPVLDPGIKDALTEYVTKKKASMPDAFM